MQKYSEDKNFYKIYNQFSDLIKDKIDHFNS